MSINLAKSHVFRVNKGLTEFAKRPYTTDGEVTPLPLGFLVEARKDANAPTRFCFETPQRALEMRDRFP